MIYDEERLTKRIKQGDREAQQALYDTYARRLLAVAMRYVGRRDVAEDTLHDALIRIFSSINKFNYRGKGSLRAWMERIVINTSLEWLRNNKRIDTITLNHEFDKHNPTTEPTTEQAASIPHDKLMQFITELPDGYRVVFNLYCIEGYSHREIAEQLNINEKSSSSQLLRARRALAKRINEYIDRDE